MALIKSISGIRGTIGGKPGENLSPLDIVKFTAAYGSWVRQNNTLKKIVIGRDARISGQMVSNLVVNTLTSLGLDVVDLGFPPHLLLSLLSSGKKRQAASSLPQATTRKNGTH